MPHHNDLDDEDWYDDEEEDDESDEDETSHCPECGGPVPAISDRCPACGYWLVESDRPSMFSSAKPLWIKVAAVALLLAFVAGALAAVGVF